jgi:hypothetical protein
VHLSQYLDTKKTQIAALLSWSSSPVTASSISLVGNSSHEPGKRAEVPRDQVLGLLRQKPVPFRPVRAGDVEPRRVRRPVAYARSIVRHPTEPIGTGQRFDLPARPVRLAWQWAPPDRSENPCRVTLLPRPVAEAVVAVLASRKCITVSGARRTRPYIVDSGHARWEQVDKFLAKPLAGCSFPKKLS